MGDWYPKRRCQSSQHFLAGRDLQQARHVLRADTAGEGGDSLQRQPHAIIPFLHT